MANKPINVSVELGGKIKSVDHLIKVFIKKCKKEGIVKEFRDKLICETKGQKKRRKKAAGEARAKSQKKKIANPIPKR
jgi:ribosomal protein S21